MLFKAAQQQESNRFVFFHGFKLIVFKTVWVWNLDLDSLHYVSPNQVFNLILDMYILADF